MCDLQVSSTKIKKMQSRAREREKVCSFAWLRKWISNLHPHATPEYKDIYALPTYLNYHCAITIAVSSSLPILNDHARISTIRNFAYFVRFVLFFSISFFYILFAGRLCILFSIQYSPSCQFFALIFAIYKNIYVIRCCSHARLLPSNE